MLKLCLKDLRAARWLLLAEWVLFVLYVMQPYFGNQLIIILGGVLALSNIYQILFLEDRNKTEILYLSLPIKRSMIVEARFLLGFLLSSGALFIFGLIALINFLFHSPSSALGRFSLFSTEAVVLFLLISAHFLSLFLVFYHCFGFGRGTVSFIIYGTLLALSGVILLSLIPVNPELFKESGGFLLASLRAIRVSLGTELFLLSAAVIVVVPYVLSLRLSLRFYEKREF